MENRIIGKPRLRQIKVHNSSCDIPETFGGIIKRCYGRYGTSLEDKESFPPERLRYSSLDAWTYKTYQELDSSSLSHWGKVATYSPNGYTQLLPDNKTAAQLMMAELKRNLWVSPGTRVVFIDFTVYNINLNHWCIVRQTFEFPAAGGVVANSYYTVTKLMRYQDTGDHIVLGAEITVIVFLVFYTIEEIIEMATLGLKTYFKRMSNNADWTVIVLCSLILGHRAVLYLYLEPALSDVSLISDKFVDFTTIAHWSYFFDSITGCCAFLAWVKIFKYVSFNKVHFLLVCKLFSSFLAQTGHINMPHAINKSAQYCQFE